MYMLSATRMYILNESEQRSSICVVIYLAHRTFVIQLPYNKWPVCLTNTLFVILNT